MSEALMAGPVSSNSLKRLKASEQINRRAPKPMKADGSGMLVCWVTKVECVSAFARRAGRALCLHPMAGMLERLDSRRTSGTSCSRRSAPAAAPGEMLRVHPLRAGDALQLAAALLGSEGDPKSLELMTLDEQLSEAANKEGFVTLPGL